MPSDKSGVSRRRFLEASAGGLAAVPLTGAIVETGMAADPLAPQQPPQGLYPPTTVRTPSVPELRRIVAQHGLAMSDNEIDQLRRLIANGLLPSYKRLDQYVEPTLPVSYPRSPGYRPTADDNKNNAWYWRCAIKGAADGRLAGQTVAIDDSIMVAGVPMMYGATVLDGFSPDQDATVVSRILDAGGEIIGKSVSEQLGLSGGSHTSDTGPVSNPHDRFRSAGGAASGAAVLVVDGECDMAVASDAGGWLRIPSAWSGAVGLKPTFGLVPTTGAVSFDATLDHIGPIARNTTDCARLLEAIAGGETVGYHRTGRDPSSYVDALIGDAQGLKIGIVTEGFGWPASEPDSDAMVFETAQRLAEVGAEVREISVPMHRDAIHFWNGIMIEGGFARLIDGNGGGTNHFGPYMTAFQDRFALGRKTRGADLAETVKLLILVGQYMHDNYHGRYYAKARNLSRVLQAAYDATFNEVDILVMPTTPMKPTELPPPNANGFEIAANALPMIPNTAAFNVTGHPALSIPAGASMGLPVGLMMVGRFGDDATVLRAAHALEQLA